jgi:predicted nuclease of predicted toxin-antitoxin system
MSLCFFVDQCVPRTIVDALRKPEYRVELLRDHLSPDSPDSEVIAFAQKIDAVLVSLNGDFTNIVNYPPSSYGGIIAVQVKNQPASIPVTVVRLLTYLAIHPERDHYRRKLFLIEPHRIRIRE